MEVGDLTIRDNRPNVLSDLHPTELPRIRAIQFTIRGEQGDSVRIRVQRVWPAVVLTVHGGERTQVEGLSARLSELMSQGYRSPGRSGNEAFWWVGAWALAGATVGWSVLVESHETLTAVSYCTKFLFSRCSLVQLVGSL